MVHAASVPPAFLVPEIEKYKILPHSLGVIIIAIIVWDVAIN